MDTMRDIINRNLLKHAVGRAITCQCGDILDATRAVLLTSPTQAWIGCVACWGRGPFTMDARGWSVLDGRVLFARPARVARRRRKTVGA